MLDIEHAHVAVFPHQLALDARHRPEALFGKRLIECCCDRLDKLLRRHENCRRRQAPEFRNGIAMIEKPKRFPHQLVSNQSINERPKCTFSAPKQAVRFLAVAPAGSANPLAVPLLIPELRYEGRATKHKYRLDFCVINPISMQKTGFELSPWSTHGELTGTKGKTQKEINAEASANFEKEMKKHKQYYKRYGIFSLVYTDTDLSDIDAVFAHIEDCLDPKAVNAQLNFHLLSSFFEK